MDTTAEEITFDDKGVCSFCKIAQRELLGIEAEKGNLSKMIERVKKDGEGRDYDCLIGLSGGVDSSLALHYAVEQGLRPLCFSIDNGWNTPGSDENIMRLVEGMKVPFYRYTIDVKTFRELQSAFIKAGQKNIEIPTDHILGASTFEMANKYGIKWVISGGNVATESIMPFSWGYHARDLKHIKAIYTWATRKKLKGLPVCSILDFNYYKWVKKIKTFYLLDYYTYNRAEAIKLLGEKYGYKEYGDKHCESYFTWWFQNYYLFTKFGIDKRKAHYSSLINSKQMTRDEALELLGKDPVYPQLGLEQKIQKYPMRHYSEFPTDEKLFNRISKIIKFIRGITQRFQYNRS